MSALAKVFVVLNFVMAVFFFSASATLFLTRVDWREAYKTYKSESAAQLKILSDSQGKLRAANDELKKKTSVPRGAGVGT